MEQSKKTISPLHKLSGTIEALDSCSKKLIRVMEEQIDAIIASDTVKIETLSDKHSSLTWKYKKYEEEFIRELSEIFNHEMSSEERHSVRLLALKTHYPQWEEQIDVWHRMLTNNAKMLQAKHKQVIQLLEFAMEQNARLLHSMYSEHNEKNAHYGSNGSRSSINTGVAVNQEV